MTSFQVLMASVCWSALIAITYAHIGWNNVAKCLKLWATRDYWVHAHNKVEAIAWVARAAVLIPGLIFGAHFWVLYWFTLMSSLALIWASSKKLMPTLVSINTFWAWLSCMVLSQHIF